MNKTRPYTRISKTLSRLANRNKGWKIPVPTAPLTDPYVMRHVKHRLNRRGKNLAKKGKTAA